MVNPLPRGKAIECCSLAQTQNAFEVIPAKVAFSEFGFGLAKFD